ncbi:virulence-associated e family protein [Adhaeribacter arboris]|uniref:Virulence-associated e family protein n=1 Tax=Adhaeribacter arboris TaxID=2072846 RepID=A0A2T2YCM6_9BACT|nr:VapE domain-containing protein [Adhaeribacter arboris]PSR53267.1 virulence-associated e family protein [Adhaeribacter arboris]
MTSRRSLTYHQGIEYYLKKWYTFKVNKVNDRIYYAKKPAKAFQVLDETAFNSIIREIKNDDNDCSADSLRRLLHSDFSQQYDPFTSYFEGLPTWDQQEDHIETLASTVKTHNDKFWKYCLKKWIVGVIACALDNEAVNQTAIVFTGKQAVGKTTWMNKLVPKPLKEYAFSGTINPKNKDSEVYLAECLFIFMDELETLNRTSLGSLKELMTKLHIKIRRPYNTHSENLIRRASFAGTVNNREFLNDPTGSRRFLTFETLKIDHLHKINLDLVYAQAYSLWKSGFQFWFDSSDADVINKNNEEFQVTTIEEELLLKYFEPATKASNLYKSNTDILTYLSQKESIEVNQANKTRLAKALQRHKFETGKKGEGVKVYYLKEIPVVDSIEKME